jgi:hypothetical protein
VDVKKRGCNYSQKCFVPRHVLFLGLILYIKQNPTTYKETTNFAFLLESSTTNQSIPSNIIYSSPHTPFPKKKKKKWSSTES